jgi:ubiquitin-protein ligase
MYQARGEATWRNVLWADDNQTAVYTLLSTLVAKTVTDARTAIDEQDSIATDVAGLADSRLQAAPRCDNLPEATLPATSQEYTDLTAPQDATLSSLTTSEPVAVTPPIVAPSRHEIISAARVRVQSNKAQWNAMLATGSLKRIKKELDEISAMPISGCSAGPKNNTDLHVWEAIVIGPEGTPYHGGIFKLDIVFPPEYPFKAPNITFRTRIHHCNINSLGAICLDILRDNWSPALTISKVLLSLLILLSEPNPDVRLTGAPISI